MKGLFGVWCLLLASGAFGADYYVDVDSRGGPCDDANLGTPAKPWRTLTRATSGQKPGDTIWIRGGVYGEQVLLQTGGTADRPLIIRAFAGEKPVIDGEGQRAQGIRLPEEGRADYVVIEGLTLRNFRSSGVGLCVSGRTGVTIRDVEVSDAGTGVLFNSCTKSQLLKSHVHHCESGNVLVDTACSDIVVADNHIHHNRTGMGLSVYSPGDGVRGQGAVLSVTPHAPGLARLTLGEFRLDTGAAGTLDKVRGGTLIGQDAAGSVANPGLVLFFPDKDPSPDGEPIGGGMVRLADGRDWFVLRNHPDWGNKPYSPDGKTGLLEIGRADLAALSKAKYVYVAYTFPRNVANRDIQILRNEVDHAAVQGIWVQRAEGVLLQGNRTHHNAATGIQIESLCRRIWIDGNISYANSIAYSHETGIWLDETIDAVVQNNVCYENQKGMGVTQCEWVLVRRNVLYNNRAQHVPQNVEGCRSNAGGLWYSGGRHHHLGAPPGAQHNAFVHNTVYGNGTEVSSWGGIQHGIPGYPRVGRNRILNNLVQNALGAYAVYAGCTPVVLDGNLYHGTGPIRALWRQADRETSYTLSEAQGLADWQRDTGQDRHSQVAQVAFADAKAGDLRLVPGSVAVDGGQPLTRTTSAGSGTRVPVEDVSCFSAGFKTREGKVLILGDEIMIAGTRTRIAGLDRSASLLILEHSLRWSRGDPVTYVHQGAGPDVGAFEAQ